MLLCHACIVPAALSLLLFCCRACCRAFHYSVCAFWCHAYCLSVVVCQTHLRNTDASERELEALAIYMGHSLAQQRGSYDRRSKELKVAPAIDLLNRLNSKWNDFALVVQSSSLLFDWTFDETLKQSTSKSNVLCYMGHRLVKRNKTIWKWTSLSTKQWYNCTHSYGSCHLTDWHNRLVESLKSIKGNRLYQVDKTIKWYEIIIMNALSECHWYPSSPTLQKSPRGHFPTASSWSSHNAQSGHAHGHVQVIVTSKPTFC